MSRRTQPGHDAALVALAFAIADDQAICEIECNAVRERVARALWWNTEPMLDPDKLGNEEIAFNLRLLRYARVRGLLEYHPERAALVRVLRKD